MELRSMNEAADLSATIERIYDAGLTPSLWPAALGCIATFVNGYSAAIFSKTPSQTGGALYHHDGRIGDEFQRAYFSQYIKLDPANALQYFGEIEKPVSASSLIPPEEFIDTRFYREWAEPQGLVDFVTVALEMPCASAALFGVFRHVSQGIADEFILRRMELLAPHLRRAILIGRTFDTKSDETAVLADTLDSLSGALFLVDRQAGIVHANAVANQAIARQDVCNAPAGRLTFRDRTANDLLKAMLGELAATSGPSLPNDLLLSLERADGERFMAHVLPLACRGGRAHKADSAVALVYLLHAALELDSAPTVIAKTYGLTPTELRVLLAIVDIGGVPETAASLGIGEGTVKTHLRHIFVKTGAVRQGDLIRLVAAHSSPMQRRAPVPAAKRLKAIKPIAAQRSVSDHPSPSRAAQPYARWAG